MKECILFRGGGDFFADQLDPSSMELILEPHLSFRMDWSRILNPKDTLQCAGLRTWPFKSCKIARRLPACCSWWFGHQVTIGWSCCSNEVTAWWKLHQKQRQWHRYVNFSTISGASWLPLIGFALRNFTLLLFDMLKLGRNCSRVHRPRPQILW